MERRVQIVEKSNTSILRPILEEWYEKTGCPMLLNTSLNIKGQPIVNDWNDGIKKFMEKYNVGFFRKLKLHLKLYLSTWRKKDKKDYGDDVYPH